MEVAVHNFVDTSFLFWRDRDSYRADGVIGGSGGGDSGSPRVRPIVRPLN